MLQRKQNAMGRTLLIEKTAGFVRSELSGNDASHDFDHIDRVRNLALRLAYEEGVSEEVTLEVIHLAALLHDIADWKYSNSETAGAEKAREFLTLHDCPDGTMSRVLFIVKNLGFKNELGNSLTASELPLEFKIVQDADRIDAIGAIGVCRCMLYTGAKTKKLHTPGSKPLLNMSKEQYMTKRPYEDDTAINHFYEKLLKLKDMMKTTSGRRLAEGRHKYMESFLEQFYAEWEGCM
eukprot:ANDGO_00808.mRNA.1 Uncharacterized protein YpgQ